MFLLRLHPLPVFLVFLGVLLASQFVMHLGPLEIVFPMAIVIFASTCFGYMVLVALGLASLFPESVRVKRIKLLSVFGFTVIFCLFGLRIMMLMAESDPVDRGFLLVLWFLGVAAPLYICWVAARSLVAAEEGHRLKWDRNIGTFLLFYFLPIGLIFIQMRLRRLLGAPREGAGGKPAERSG